MRKITFFKMMLVTMLALMSNYTSAQLLIENFDYSLGQVLTATATADPSTGWLSHSGNGTANIDVTSGLTFTGYAGSGIGGAANLDNNGQDINKTFTSQTTGTVYAAFIIQTQSTNSAGYFFMLSPSPVASTFYSRVYINATGDGIGISGSSAPSNYISITAGTPTLIVVKCDIVSKTSSLFILNSFSSAEPTNANQTFTESTITSIGAIALRQYAAAQKIIIDGIRVGNTWSDVVAPSQTLSTSTPTFSPTPGNYITNQNIELSSATIGAKIYYTTDGSTPDKTKTLYNSAINIASTTTVKAIAYDASDLNPSSIATATYTFPTSVATIADLRAATTPGFYKLTGEAVLTLKSTTRNAKYIQDATGAVLIDDNSGIITTAYNVGDGITGIIGTTALYNNMLQFTPVADPGAATSTGNTVTPATVALTDLINNQGKLVKVLSATITGTGNFAVSTSYNLNGSASTVIRAQYADLDYVGQAIPTTAQDITGVVLVYGTTAQLVPRSLSDFTPALGTGLTQTKNTNIYPSNGHIVLSATANQTVEIFNAVGQKLLSHKAVEGINTIPVSTKGLVLVKIGNQISKVIL